MSDQAKVTITAKYFLALQEVRRCAELVAMANEGSDEYAGFVEDLEAALGALLELEDGPPEIKGSDAL